MKNLFPEYRHPNSGTNKITGNFPQNFFLQLKFTENLIPVSMCIPLPLLMTQYFPWDFSHNHVASETT